MPPPAKAVTLDFYNTLAFHREGRGRGRVLMEYLTTQGFRPARWEHQVLYDVFAPHDRAYSPSASPSERQAYHAELAGRVFDRMGIRASPTDISDHAAALWQILGPACFGVFPDVFPALQALRARGIPLAVVSNWQSGLRHICTELGLADFFDQVLSSADVGVEKPDQRIFIEACKRLGVAPELTLHVGDTYLDDYVGGESAGLQVALIDRAGLSDRTDTRSVRSLTDLLDLVD